MNVNQRLCELWYPNKQAQTSKKKLEINRSQICINDDYKRSWLEAQDYYHIVPFSFADYHMIYRS